MFNFLKLSKFYIVLVVICSVVFSYTVYDFFQYQSQRTEKSIQLGKSQNNEVKVILDKNIQLFESITQTLADKVSNESYPKDDLIQLIVETSEISELGLGVTVAFEPYAFDDDIELFAPYYDKRQRKTIDIALLYDYTEKNEESAVWYTAVIKEAKPLWSKPYYANGAKQLVADYGVPLFQRKKDGEARIIGMVSYTLSLEQLSKFVNKISLGASGFGYIATTDLDLVTHPNLDFLIHPEKVKEAVKSEPKFKRFKTEKQGHFKIFSGYTFEKSDVYFSTLKNGWILSVVFNSVDLLGPDHAYDNKIIHISLALSIGLLLLLVILLKVYLGETKRLWAFSILFSIVLMVNIFLFCFVIIYSDVLDQIKIGGFKVGFWFAQQGSIYIFVVIIFLYVWLMKRLDKKLSEEEDI